MTIRALRGGSEQVCMHRMHVGNLQHIRHHIESCTWETGVNQGMGVE